MSRTKWVEVIWRDLLYATRTLRKDPVFTIVLIANVTESSFARERDLLTFVFFLIALAEPIAINQTINAPRGAALPAGGDTAPWRPDVVSKA